MALWGSAAGRDAGFMPERKIPLHGHSGPEALTAARRVLEHMGYLWQQAGPDRAVAYEGGKVIRHRSSHKLALELHADAGSGALILRRATNGAVGFATGMGILPPMRVRRTFSKVSRELTRALRR